MAASHATVEWTKIRSELANTVKRNPEADLTDLRRDLRAARLADYIKRQVDAAPPLTSEQRLRLAALLTGAA